MRGGIQASIASGVWLINIVHRYYKIGKWHIIAMLLPTSYLPKKALFSLCQRMIYFLVSHDVDRVLSWFNDVDAHASRYSAKSIAHDFCGRTSGSP